ncbi:PilZ domain-containing protein [Anaeromyxobacter paludicola]|uniref:PilZ domain-containing protein n=1 Tax=Anaeromyxobacter paludicola TaxID=2918171 RepID=A0ABM7X8U2_9BACT|nr:PilZ domain-containing protein [Anaeromyxobacter paludicola]BDG08272.1 hypothetical protein AMPC_13850 [Anaeromyxobacter paludicola]
MAGASSSLRVLAVGADPELAAALHLHLARAGHAVYAVPAPAELDLFLRAAAPHLVVLMLPASPDAAWGGALTTAASAARVGVRVVLVAPSREVVEPLAAVAGAERAYARADLLARPLALLDGGAARPAPRFPAPAAPAHAAPWPAEALALEEPDAPPPERPAPRRAVDLSALIEEELLGEAPRPRVTRVEVNVSLVSDHNFFVGTTRRVDSGGVFIATQLPPPVGTRLQVRLGLADGRKLDLEGEVAFVREKGATTGRQPSGCGVRLEGLPGWAVEAIDRFTLARQPILVGADR